MYKKVLLGIALVGFLVIAPLATGAFSAPADAAPCACCGDACSCEDCACDATDCACDSSGDCGSDPDCCSTRCADEA